MARHYRVAGSKLVPEGKFDWACGRAVTLSLQSRESVCIETVVEGKVVERIDVTAALSIDCPNRCGRKLARCQDE